MGTATSVLECSNRYPWLGEVNCTTGSVPYGEFGSNASITGIGTDISFVLTAGLSLVTCGVVQYFCDRLKKHTWRKLLEPLVTSFGDQQILRGLSLSIATLYSPASCTIDAYRYNVLCYLLLMTIVSHVSSVLVLRSYVNGQIMLSCVRFFLVFAQIFFVGIIFSSRVTDAFPTSIPSASEARNTTLVLPAVCFEHGNSQPYTGLEDIPHPHTKDSAALTMYVLLFIFYGINIIITIAHVFTYLFNRERTWEVRDKEKEAEKWSWFWWLSVLRGLILLSAWIIWVWAVIKMYEIKKWMTNSGWMSGVNLWNDNQWNFGQLMSVLLLAAAPISFLNSWSDFQKARREELRKTKNAAAGYSGMSPSTPGFSSQAALLGTRSRYSSQTTFESRRTSDLYSIHSNPPAYDESETEMHSFIPPPGRQRRRPEV